MSAAPIVVRYAVEGATDEPVAEKLLTLAGFVPQHTLTARGKTKLDPKIPGLNRAAAGMPWLVLRDVDHDDANSCVPDLLSSLLGGQPPSPRMCLRLAVREVEAWLLADRDAIASHFHLRRRVPDNPEAESDPKAVLVNLCGSSRRRDVREGMVPREASGRAIGPEYVALVRDFAAQSWDPMRARHNAPSLDLAIRAVEQLREGPA